MQDRTAPDLALISTAAMLGDQGYRPPTSWDVTVVDSGFHAATVDVTYTVEGRELQQELLLERVAIAPGSSAAGRSVAACPPWT